MSYIYFVCKDMANFSKKQKFTWFFLEKVRVVHFLKWRQSDTLVVVAGTGTWV